MKMHVDDKVCNEYFHIFFSVVYARMQEYYVNYGNGQYVDILYVEHINYYGTKVYTKEFEFWILKVEKMLSRVWVKKNSRKRDPMKIAKMNEKMSRNWKTKKKDQLAFL